MPETLAAWLERIEQGHSGSIELGLERCAEVWARMGSPPPAARVVTVAGTNGKGSTVAGIEAGLRALGHHVGSYTSPHLLHYNERIRIDCENAPDDAIVRGFELVETALGDSRLTWFEFCTLAAFATFSEAQLDFLVLEVGLGGRLDAVNLIDADVAVITPIGLDHQQYLGTDRESVAFEKAGIMRPACTVVCSDRDPPDSIFAKADELGVRLIRIGADFDIAGGEQQRHQGEWRYFFADVATTFSISMNGAHQADNLAAALTTVLLCDPGAELKLERVATAVGACRVRGRLERVATEPEVIVDVGHNALAASIIRDYLEMREVDKCRIVLGMLLDKDPEGVAEVLRGRVLEWYCASLAGPRAQSGTALAGRLRTVLPDTPARAFASVGQALSQAITDAGEEGLVVVFGSFVTASEAISHIEGSN